MAVTNYRALADAVEKRSVLLEEDGELRQNFDELQTIKQTELTQLQEQNSNDLFALKTFIWDRMKQILNTVSVKILGLKRSVNDCLCSVICLLLVNRKKPRSKV